MIVKKMNLFENSTLYRFGTPFKTGAITINLNEQDFSFTDKMDYFSHRESANVLYLNADLGTDRRIYGLGEALGGMNKRGRKYKCWNTDDPVHTQDKEALYGSHPFFICAAKDSVFGILIDFPGLIEMDLGFTTPDHMEIAVHSINCDIYIFRGESKLAIIRSYLQLTGTPYIPPKWAFGFQQSRWSYPDAKTVRTVAQKMRDAHIPCDAIYMDIDYMDQYKVFTVDNNKFPDLADFTKEMKDQGIKLLPIIDPGVKIEAGYQVYEEGINEEHFCTTEDNLPFTSAVWPGLVHLPDFLNQRTREWWGDKYIPLLEKGIAGFWNDMNEPALFYTPEELDKAKTAAKETVINNSWDYFSLRDKFTSLANKAEYYQSFYHVDDEKSRHLHKDIHNLYGFLMTKATSDSIKKHYPDQRYFLLSRSSYIGLHRFAAIWMGDNQSWWEHLLVNMQMLVSLNITGFFYTGADICGFGGNVSCELATRWMQFGLFNPLFRNHSALGTRDQEPFAFDELTLQRMRHFIRTRYELLPYIYTEFMMSIIKLAPFITPLSFHYHDLHSQECEDQFMFGSAIMCAPVYKPNTTGRYVTLPETHHLHVRHHKNGKTNYEVYAPGAHYIENTLDEVSYFIKENSLVISTEAIDYIDQQLTETLTITGLVTSNAVATYYEDDGTSKKYLENVFSTITFYIDKNDTGYEISYDIEQHHDIPVTIKRINFILYDEQGNEFKKIICR